ncbi:hypothetical protein [Streptomyces sp. NRRL WC-3742]|uniref:hypothetical protein n=1 Tax=Streptomyces sp. NRRL WC-3742 TaxID=1463934 RepID=UPI00131C0725|nr:hypothetical protein [Streptomyces sp. NRRL WC-3742]
MAEDQAFSVDAPVGHPDHSDHPLYGASLPGEAEEQLGTERTAQLLRLYQPKSTLRRADIELERILRLNHFSVLRWDDRSTKTWSLEEHRLHIVAELTSDGYPIDQVADEAGLIEQIHGWHRIGFCFVCEDGYIHENPEGAGLF